MWRCIYINSIINILINKFRDILWNKSNEFDSVKKYLDFLYSTEENNNGYNSASSNNNNNINSNSSSNNMNSNSNANNGQSYTELVINDVQVKYIFNLIFY